MNILITGSNGQLGRCIKDISSNYNHTYFFTNHNTLDITNSIKVENFIKSNNINIIVNCAAYTNVDKAESNLQAANSINNVGVKILAQAIEEAGGYMIHISTDYVFDGKHNVPYIETDTVMPLGVYGITKYLGENAINSNRHIIIRTSWLYSEYGKNFLNTMIKLSLTHKEITVVYDQIGSPTYAGDLAKVIFEFINNPVFGLYHFSNEGVCSWYDFAYAIFNLTNSTCKITPILSSEYKTEAVRPNYSVLDKSKIKKTLNIDIPNWRESLKICLHKL